MNSTLVQFGNDVSSSITVPIVALVIGVVLAVAFFFRNKGNNDEDNGDKNVGVITRKSTLALALIIVSAVLIILGVSGIVGNFNGSAQGKVAVDSMDKETISSVIDKAKTEASENGYDLEEYCHVEDNSDNLLCGGEKLGAIKDSEGNKVLELKTAKSEDGNLTLVLTDNK